MRKCGKTGSSSLRIELYLPRLHLEVEKVRFNVLLSDPGHTIIQVAVAS